MTRAALDYTARREPVRAAAGAQDVSTPVAGFYRFRLSAGSVIGGVELFYGPPNDPVTGEVLDRSWRWQALFDDQPVDFDRVWPGCTGSPVTEAEYRALVARREWARTNAPNSAYARIGRKIDLLSAATPMPF